jgi:virulence factor Mce-like protein
MRRPRRRRDTEPAYRTIAKGLAVITFVGVVIWFAVSAYNGIPFVNYSTIYVSIPQAGNLLQHDPVRIAGVRVGQVLGKSLSADGNVRLQLQLDPGVKLPANTTVRVRASGLLGARYVELIPGSSGRALAAGSTITASANALTYGVPDALDTFDAQTRGALGTAVHELGDGVLGRGTQLNEAIHLSATNMVPFQQLATTILSDPGAAQRLLPSLDQMTRALAHSRIHLSNTLGPAASALEPLTADRAAVRDALAKAPAALATADSGLAEGEQLLGGATAVAQAAQQTLPDAPRGLSQLTALLGGSHGDLQQAASLLQTARPAVPSLLDITASLQPLLGPLLRGLGDLTPMLQQIAPYGCNIENFGAVFRSVTGFGGNGTGPNGPAMEFRLSAVPPGGLQGLLGGTDTTGLTARDGYPRPCAYLAGPYPTIGAHSG